MKPLNEIIEQHTDEDNQTVDFPAMIKATVEEMGTFPDLSPLEHLAITRQHTQWGLNYLGGIVLSVADQLGALPEGFDAEYENLQLALEWDELQRIYAVKYGRTQKRIEVPGQPSIPIPGEG